ncbi:MAG: TonB-dependent receptor plug domain-containing protein, partial [Cyclobacteriaceae bacterium]|nr:TonB-dependent receptor plug domain-containing protein [Cyclobacteriaceae bacterium]
MKFSLLKIILFFLGLSIYNYSNAQEIEYAFDFENKSLIEALHLIERKSDYQLIYNPSDLDRFHSKGMVKNMSLYETLNYLLQGKGLYYIEIPSNKILVFKADELSEMLQEYFAVNTLNSTSKNSFYPSKKLNKEIIFYKLKGFVSIANSDEIPLGLSVFNGDKSIGTNVLFDGSFELNLPIGINEINVEGIGFDSYSQKIILNTDTSVYIQMYEKTTYIDEVVITDQYLNNKIESNSSGVDIVTIEQIKSMPAFLGEVDVLKSIISLPGISSVGEGTGGFNVRGGTTDGNLILYDGIPVFNPSHLFGFFSVFNAGSLSSFTLYKGSLPAKFGGRNSSVLDIKTKSGNKDQLLIAGSAGLTSSSLTIEGPVIKDKATFIASARKAYPSWMFQFVPDKQVKKSRAGFQDVNLGLNYLLSKKSYIELKSFYSKDNFNFTEDTLYSWQNSGLKLAWKNNISSTKSLEVNFVQSNYLNNIDGYSEFKEFNYTSGVNFSSINTIMYHFINENDIIEYGTGIESFSNNTGSINPTTNNSIVNTFNPNKDKAFDFYGFFSIEKTFNS